MVPHGSHSVHDVPIPPCYGHRNFEAEIHKSRHHELDLIRDGANDDDDDDWVVGVCDGVLYVMYG